MDGSLEDRIAALMDEAEIARLLIRYATALDFRDWELLATCFVPDVQVSYLNAAVLNDRDAVIDHCRRALGRYEVTQHALTNPSVRISGDTATATCYLRGEHVIADGAHRRRWTLGGRYEDRLVRTADGWRISQRTLIGSWELASDVPDPARSAG